MKKAIKTQMACLATAENHICPLQALYYFDSDLLRTGAFMVGFTATFAVAFVPLLPNAVPWVERGYEYCMGLV